MEDKSMRERFHQAIDSTLSGLTGDPWLARRILAREEQGEKNVKTKKISVGLILVIVLLLAAVSATAAAFLSGREVIEKTAVPLAKENDSPLRAAGEYTADQVAELVRVANENGITLSETTGIMRALRKGEGYYEEEAIMEICREAFGGLFYEWTIEEKHWYEEMMVAIGYQGAQYGNPYCIPGEGDMTVPEARAYAVSLLKESYGPDIGIDDPALYRREEDFISDLDEEGHLYPPIWYFNYIPRDLDRASYGVTFDREGNVLGIDEVTPAAITTADELIQRMTTIYRSQTQWTPEVWHELEERMRQLDGEPETMEYKAYAHSRYPLPVENDLTARDALAIAFQACGDADAYNPITVLLGDGDKRVWKVSLTAKKQEAGEIAQYSYFYWEIDAEEGSVLREGELNEAGLWWARYVLQSTYEEFTSGLMRPEQALSLAAAALRTKLNDETIPFDDPAVYQASAAYRERTGVWIVYFYTKDLYYGTCSALVDNATGKVSVQLLDGPGLTGDNAYARYQQVNRGVSPWTQEMWTAFSEIMQGLEATTMEGKLLKNTAYPPLTDAYITKEQAVDIAYADLDAPWAEELYTVLIGADPHPVWKIRMWADEPSILYEIDAVTGEILDLEKYKADNYDFNSPLKLVTLHRDYAAAYVREYGPAQAAAVAVSLEYGDPWADDPMLPLLMEGVYETAVDGNTVTFTARYAWDADYRVTLDEYGVVTAIEVLRAGEGAAGVYPPSALEDRPVPTPTPRPDGKPWMWGGDFAPAEFWTQMEQTMRAYGVTFDNIEEKAAEWDARWGGEEAHALFWPQECLAVYTVLCELGGPEDPFFQYAPFPQADGVTQEQAIEIAWEAFRPLCENLTAREAQIVTEEWIASLRPSAYLWYTSWPAYQMDPGVHWVVQMMRWEGGAYETRGYVILSEDGEVLFALLDLYGNG